MDGVLLSRAAVISRGFAQPSAAGPRAPSPWTWSWHCDWGSGQPLGRAGVFGEGAMVKGVWPGGVQSPGCPGARSLLLPPTPWFTGLILLESHTLSLTSGSRKDV